MTCKLHFEDCAAKIYLEANSRDKLSGNMTTGDCAARWRRAQLWSGLARQHFSIKSHLVQPPLEAVNHLLVLSGGGGGGGGGAILKTIPNTGNGSCARCQPSAKAKMSISPGNWRN